MNEGGFERSGLEDAKSTLSEVRDATKESLVFVMLKHKINIETMRAIAEDVIKGLGSYRKAGPQTDELGVLKTLVERLVSGELAARKVPDADTVLADFKSDFLDRLPE